MQEGGILPKTILILLYRLIVLCIKMDKCIGQYVVETVKHLLQFWSHCRVVLRKMRWHTGGREIFISDLHSSQMAPLANLKDALWGEFVGGRGEGRGGLWKFRKGVWRLVQLPFLTLGTDSTKYFNFTLPILDWLPFWALIKLLWADRNCTLNVLLARTFQNVHLLLPHPIHRVRW